MNGYCELELRISNDTSRDISFYLEPWGGRYVVPGHHALRVVIEAPSPPVLDWELADEAHRLVVYNPAGTLTTVYDGQNEVIAE